MKIFYPLDGTVTLKDITPAEHAIMLEALTAYSRRDTFMTAVRAMLQELRRSR